MLWDAGPRGPGQRLEVTDLQPEKTMKNGDST